MMNKDIIEQQSISTLHVPFDKKIHKIWTDGDKNKAISILITQINTQKKANDLYQLGCYLKDIGDHKGAIFVFNDLLQINCNDDKALYLLFTSRGMDLIIYGESKFNTLNETLQISERILQKYPLNIGTHALLTTIYGTFGQKEHAKRHGETALTLQDTYTTLQGVQGFSLIDNIQISPSKKNIISFSLFGDNKRYLRGALHNVLMGMELYPHWVMRFYIDNTVPEEFLEILKELNCEIYKQPSGQSIFEKLCWRFTVSDDSDVGRFLVRDCDSVVSAREVNAVKEWIDSKKLFHVMRDGYSHTSLILAGMWGGIANALPKVTNLLTIFSSRNASEYHHGRDQDFLALYIWPLIKQSCFVSDNLFKCFNAHQISSALSNNEQRVGIDRFAASHHNQEQFLKAWIEKYKCLK